MQAEIGDFASTFAPQVSNDVQFLDEILYSLGLIIGMGSAYAWNVRTCLLSDLVSERTS